MSITNQNLIPKEISSRLHLGSDYHSVQNLQSSYLLSKNVKICLILPIVVYRWETWSLTSQEHRLKVFGNMVLKRKCGPKRDEIIGWRKSHNKKLHNLYVLFTKCN
jgi:hypothetical protein